MTEELFAKASYHDADDPVDRLLGYVEFREQLLKGELPEYTCLLGTLLQETYATQPELRAECDAGLARHVAQLTRDVEAAKRLYLADSPGSSASLGYFIQSVLQGGFIFAKASKVPKSHAETSRTCGISKASVRPTTQYPTEENIMRVPA